MPQTTKAKPVVFEQPIEPSAVTKIFESLLPVFGALAAVLAVRLFLFFAIIGAFILAQAALPDQTEHGLYILVAYCSLTILPLVWLDSRKKG